jgi:hypothetical protein
MCGTGKGNDVRRNRSNLIQEVIFHWLALQIDQARLMSSLLQHAGEVAKAMVVLARTIVLEASYIRIDEAYSHVRLLTTLQANLHLDPFPECLAPFRS